MLFYKAIYKPTGITIKRRGIFKEDDIDLLTIQSNVSDVLEVCELDYIRCANPDIDFSSLDPERDLVLVRDTVTVV